MRKTITAVLALAASIAPATVTAAGENVFVRTGGGDIETVRLDELADGETRTFGEGEHEVTATREGDRITIRLQRDAAGVAETLDCTVGDDSCRVFVSDDDGATVFLVGESDGRIGWVTGPEEGTVVRLVELSGAAGVSLYECPEGDTTMRLPEDDSGPYSCPRHGLELKKTRRAGSRHDIQVIVDTEAEADD